MDRKKSMMEKADIKHQKHAKLVRPELGTFSRDELAFLGAPCGLIQQLTSQLIQELSANFKMAYVDADHAHGDASDSTAKDELIQNSHLVYTDKINFHRFDLRIDADSFKYRQWFNETDLVLVNGNHFKAKQQMVFIDPRKFDSLGRKLDRLTDVKGFIKSDPDVDIPDFLKEKLPDWAVIPQWDIDDIKGLASFIIDTRKANIPEVNALILAGGKSQRMGRDKGLLTYHGRPQREHLYHLTKSLGLEAFLSCRPEQTAEIPETYDHLTDSFSGLGPYGAILSAFRKNPNRAWLVIACDLPFIDTEGLNYILENRDPSAIATAFYNPETDFPDPLLTLWEPRAYSVLLQFLSQGYSCPRKVLINSNVHILQAPNANILTNVNRPEEFERVKAALDLLNRDKEATIS